MTTTDLDLELLEEYLDGAMDVSAQAQLRDRLSKDSALSDALKELQAERAMRQAVWKTMEPDTTAAQQLVWRVRGAMLNQPQRQSKFAISQWRMASFGSAAAACMVLGFFVGRLGHSGSAAPIAISPGTISTDNRGTTVMDVKPVPGDAVAHSGGFTAVGTTPRISVPVTNEYGQVVAWQTFDNPEEAKNFTEELHHTRGDATAPASSGQVKTVDEQQVPF